jgi:hypothetical protein
LKGRNWSGPRFAEHPKALLILPRFNIDSIASGGSLTFTSDPYGLKLYNVWRAQSR